MTNDEKEDLHALVVELQKATKQQQTNPFTIFAQLYGPYAFGVCSLLLIWFTIVSPQLDKNTLDFKAQSAAINQLVERDKTQEQIAETLQATSQSMSMTATILERTVERLDKISQEQHKDR